MKKLQRIVWISLLAVVVAGCAAPFLRADWLRPRITAALEAALNRPVHIGAVRLNLFTGPGFSVKDVLIDDDPAAGIEPFAHVESIDGRVSLTGLLGGKLIFSSLRLSSPSVNLVKMQSGPWNIQPLLNRPAQPGSPHRHAVPDIQIRGGRLNFKFGDDKSVFYISDADVDVYPNENGEVVLRFSGAPARTDRGTQAFGQLTVRGLLRSGSDGEDRLNLGVHMERTAISEVMRLFNGRDMGVHGFAAANATVAGPVSKLQITGDLNIHDVHRWDLMPVAGEGWTLRYRGSLDLGAHQLNLETSGIDGPPQLVSLKLRLVDYLTAPKWAVNCLFRDLPALSLLETARHMGAPLPDGVQVEGRINGGIGYSNETGVEGRLVLDNSSLKFPGGEALQFETARLLLSKDRIALAPATIRADNGQTAEIEGEYALDDSYAALSIATRQLTIAEVESSAGQILKAAPIPLLGKLQRGTWKGRINFLRERDQPGTWSGEYDLQNASMEISGLGSPVRFASASVEMKNGQIRVNRVRARAGGVDFDGDYRYDPNAGRPHRLRIRIAKVQLAQLQALLEPTFRRQESFLARTFRLRNAELPKWLREREVDAAIDVAALLKDDAPVGAFKAHLMWDGGTLQLTDIEGRLNEMRATGRMTVDLAKAVPSYRVSGSIENLNYRNGQLDLDGELTASGSGEELFQNLRSEGTFQGREIYLATDNQVGQITGAFRVVPGLGLPRLLLSHLEVAQGEDTLYGQGSAQSDGRIVLDLMSGRKQIRLTGMLLPIHPEPVPLGR